MAKPHIYIKNGRWRWTVPGALFGPAPWWTVGPYVETNKFCAKLNRRKMLVELVEVQPDAIPRFRKDPS